MIPAIATVTAVSVMANRFGMRYIPPAKDPFAPAPYIDEINDAVSELGEEVKADFEDVVSDWTTVVTFALSRKVEAGGIEIKVTPRQNKRIWDYVDGGTRPHIIRAKKPWLGSLAFRTGYSARTRPQGRAHVGSGTASGPMAFAKEVHHPGTKARNFTKTIYAKWKPELKRVVMQAIRDAKRG